MIVFGVKEKIVIPSVILTLVCIMVTTTFVLTTARKAFSDKEHHALEERLKTVGLAISSSYNTNLDRQHNQVIHLFCLHERI